MLKKRLLLLADCPSLPAEAFPMAEWDITLAETEEKARRLLGSMSFDLMACELRKKGSSLAQTVLELSMVHSLSALVLCQADQVDSLSYQYRHAPIMILPLRTGKPVLKQVADYLRKNAENKRHLQDSLNQEKRKLQDEKLVSQAKVQLVSLCRWSEERAHQYILKTAMDHSLTKAAAARQILRKLERIVDEKQKNQCNAAF